MVAPDKIVMLPVALMVLVPASKIPEVKVHELDFTLSTVVAVWPAVMLTSIATSVPPEPHSPVLKTVRELPTRLNFPAPEAVIDPEAGDVVLV